VTSPNRQHPLFSDVACPICVHSGPARGETLDGLSATPTVPGHDPWANRVGRLPRPTSGRTAPPTLSGGRG
jgi:hypothetical protein